MDQEIKALIKTWHKPELLVLVRGTPEEAVLTGCKAGPADGGLGGGKSSTGPGCGYNSGTGTCNNACSSNQKS